MTIDVVKAKPKEEPELISCRRSARARYQGSHLEELYIMDLGNARMFNGYAY
jgi:hypothetical protein